MTIRFTKKDGNKHMLTCIRDDGSVERGSVIPGMGDEAIPHDMVHYIVETVLSYKTGFFGLINQGHSITELLTPEFKRQAEYFAELLLAECLVGLIQSEHAWDRHMQDHFFKKLVQTCHDSALPPPDITPKQLTTMRQMVHKLEQDWQRLPVNETLEYEMMFSP